MKKITQLLAFGLLLTLFACSGMKEITVVAQEPDTEIYDGETLIGKGSAKVKTENSKVKVLRYKSVGYLPGQVVVNPKLVDGKDRTVKFNMVSDQSYKESVEGKDLANKWFTVVVNDKYHEDEAWKILSRTIGGYFDEMEGSDRATGYLKTGYFTKTYSNCKIRTKVIVQGVTNKPLTYRIKIVSERSNEPQVSTQDDDKFFPWDRVLKKFSELPSEFQSRLSF